jgi:hypothetical protein
MGRDRAVLALAIVSTKSEGHFSRSAGGYFAGMVRKDERGCALSAAYGRYARPAMARPAKGELRATGLRATARWHKKQGHAWLKIMLVSRRQGSYAGLEVPREPGGRPQAAASSLVLGACGAGDAHLGEGGERWQRQYSDLFFFVIDHEQELGGRGYRRDLLRARAGDVEAVAE